MEERFLSTGSSGLMFGAIKTESKNTGLHKIDRRTFEKIMSEYGKKSIKDDSMPPGCRN
ncbi:MAG: hypothetical protein M1269_08790 [Chloroflexi bacterium]|nr:hypothetical protein [Chloroflexota bacterium]